MIADEPTTALDVTIEAQILQLMKKLCEEQETSIILITHNMGVVAEICDYVYVMYAGRVMEQAETFELFDHTAHPYTKGLLKSRNWTARKTASTPLKVWYRTCCICPRAAVSAPGVSAPQSGALKKDRSCMRQQRDIRCGVS